MNNQPEQRASACAVEECCAEHPCTIRPHAISPLGMISFLYFCLCETQADMKTMIFIKVLQVLFIQKQDIKTIVFIEVLQGV